MVVIYFYETNLKEGPQLVKSFPQQTTYLYYIEPRTNIPCPPRSSYQIDAFISII